MLVTFISECEKNSLKKTRRVLDAFANRIGNNTWQTPITAEGLAAVKKLLQKTASKNTAVACHQLKTRIRTELLWIVGKKDKFNSEGIVAVNYTEADRFIGEHANMPYLLQIKELAVFAALLHDFGKASDLFQSKLKSKKKLQGDPIRHEWVSVLFLVAIVNGKSDKEWLSTLMNDEVHKTIKNLYKHDKIVDVKYPLKELPPIATMLAWLIVTHHKLPRQKEKKSGGKSIKLAKLLELITKQWGYENANQEKIKDCFEYTNLLPSQSIEWQEKIKRYAIALSNNIPLYEQIFNSNGLRPILNYARLCLMLGDHFYSSQPKDKNWHSTLKLYANTDKNEPKQQLDEHLVGVAKQAEKNADKLSAFEGLFNKDIRVINNEYLSKKTNNKNFQWQDKVVSEIKKWRKKETYLDKHQFGFFAVNIASTGKGKTIANAKIMQSLSSDENSLRYILALGLRTLTLQTGDEYRNKIGLSNTELAVLIGSKAILELHKKDNEKNEENEDETGSESSQNLNDNELIFNDFPEQGLDTVLKRPKDRQFLHAPVLACTIDHIIAATETTRGGRYILPTLRLMSSDLVIDEVDDFDGTDLIAIGRLIHLAGMLGRKVMISSATIPPDLAQGYFNVYQSGWDIFAKTRQQKNTNIGCAWVNEFFTEVKSIANKNKTDYKEAHDKFIKKHISALNKEPIKRKANIVQCSSSANNFPDHYFKTIADEALNKHQNHNFIDLKTNKKISIGIIRMANVKPCIKLTKFLLNLCEEKLREEKNVEIKTMAYHSRQVLLMRHEQEKYLDKILKRKPDENGNYNQHILEDPCIRKHIDNAQTKNVVFILVATPVEEVGRDHDFDWAVIEPSSYRSFIQLAGRVLRHRDKIKTIDQPNIAILQYNYRTIETAGEKVKNHHQFQYPGYQRSHDDLTTFDLEKLVNKDELAQKLDATQRIQKTNTSELANLEHKIISELLTNSSKQGAETMQSWLSCAWWLSGVPQQYVRFRGNSLEDMIVFLGIEDNFFEKTKDNKVATDNITIEKDEFKNLWLYRNYQEILEKQKGNKDLEKIMLIYGEIRLPTYGKPLTNQKFVYHEQLGLTQAD